MRITFLGTGTSRGIPVIGCECKTCRSEDPLNKRLRASVWIQGEASVVIDTSVDFRTQMLRHGVRKLDAVVLTHHHADHVLGLDDVYPFNIWSKKAIEAYASPETLAEVTQTFRHLFGDRRYPGIPHIEIYPVDGDFQVGDLVFQPVPVWHGRLPILGFRVGDFAYLTDVSRIPDDSMEKLKGLEVLVLSGLRYEYHPTHLTIEQAIEVAAQLEPEETYLTHLSHEVEHNEASRLLPKDVHLAYDGLILEV